MKKLLLLPAILLAGCVYNAPYQATNADFQATKSSSSCQAYILGILPIGTGNTLEEAKKTGRISKVATVDTSFENYFLFAKRCTHITGQ